MVSSICPEDIVQHSSMFTKVIAILYVAGQDGSRGRMQSPVSTHSSSTM